MNLSIIKEAILRPIELFFYIKGVFTSHKSIMFFPHPQMCKYDHYDVINYKSDSTLSFLHFILINGLLLDYTLIVILADDKEIFRQESYCKERFPNRNIKFYALIHDENKSATENFKRRIKLQNLGCRCSHIFASRTYSVFRHILSNQILVNLGYYPAPFKRDVYLPMNNYNPGKITDGKRYDCYITNSEISKCLVYPAFAIPYNKYVSLGMCRNDGLLDNDDYSDLRECILKDVPYKVKKIILYTPTHRDHFENGIGIAQTILGFDINMDLFDSYMQSNNMFIICKLHPKLHPDKLNKDLPSSIRVHKSNQDYGLAELMRISDALITDYTSGYFDYLLLDKPVIFNFFDFKEFNETRGMMFEPIESILAGDVITDESSLKEALNNIDDNSKRYKEKRKVLRDLFFSYQDANNCKRVFDYFFNNLL